MEKILRILVVFIFLPYLTEEQDLDQAYNAALRSGKVQTKSFSQSMPRPVHVLPKGKDDVLDVYCFVHPESRSLWKVWSSVCFEMNIIGYAALYHEVSEEKVFEKSMSQMIEWSRFRPHNLCVSPFVSSCFGVQTQQSYRYQLKLYNVTQRLEVCYVVGILLFLLAGRLSRSETFYYIFGLLIGLIMSVLLASLIVAQLLPKKLYIMGLSIVTGGSLTVYLINLVWINMQYLLSHYCHYVCLYVSVCSLICLSYLYYRGPVSNERSRNLFKCSLQVVALLLVYSGSHIIAFTATTMIILLVLQTVRAHSGF